MAEDIVKPEETLEIDMNEGEVRDEVASEVFGDEFTNEENIAFLKRQIEELDTGASFAKGTTTQGANGDVSITGIGFKPSFIRVIAFHQQDGTAAFSIGTATSTSDESCFLRYNDGSNYVLDVVSGNLVYSMDSSGSNTIRAALKSFDSDGFTLTWSNYSAGSTKYTYECYK